MYKSLIAATFVRCRVRFCLYPVQGRSREGYVRLYHLIVLVRYIDAI